MRLLPRDPEAFSEFVKALVQAVEKSLAEDGPAGASEEAAPDRPPEGGPRPRRRRKT